MHSKKPTYAALKDPQDYFKGIGQVQLPTPTDILLFCRITKDKLQQAALQNRSHHRFVLAFNLMTEGYIHVDNRMLPFGPGQALLILPYQFHHFSHLESTKLQWLFCTFELKAETFLEPLRNQVLEVSTNTLHAREALFEEWQRCTAAPTKGEFQNEQLQIALIRLLVALKKDRRDTHPNPLAEPHDSLLRSINRCMSEWRGRTVLVGDLARELNLSESRLRTLFKETAGIPLGSYIQNYRLNRAMALLRTTTLPVAEIAEEAGFGSPQSFSRVFRNEIGETPRAYRKIR
jgi:AraC-like DNA-binding protein